MATVRVSAPAGSMASGVRAVLGFRWFRMVSVCLELFGSIWCCAPGTKSWLRGWHGLLDYRDHVLNTKQVVFHFHDDSSKCIISEKKRTELTISSLHQGYTAIYYI